MTGENQLPVYDIVVPIIVWSLIIGVYLYHVCIGAYRPKKDKHKYHSYDFFQQMRKGWVVQNHLTGQAAANTTRDYFRVLIFLGGNALVIATILAGFISNAMSQEMTIQNKLRIAKLTFCVLVFLVIFILLLYAIRFATHFHFLINVKEIAHRPVTHSMLSLVFERAHSYYAAGLRLYLLAIPLFAWFLSTWALLVVCPIYLYAVYDYENLNWMNSELLPINDEVENVLVIGVVGSV